VQSYDIYILIINEFKLLQIYTRIIRWWVLCALVRECMASTAALQCSFHGRDTYANCHRFDQTALNILTAHHFPYNDEVYFYDQLVDMPRILWVERQRYVKEPLNLCLQVPNNNSKSPQASLRKWNEI